MFGLGKVPCVLCDHLVPRRETFRLQDRNGIAICMGCREKWERAGAICARCHTPVRGARDAGVLLDRYGFGHVDCGAVQLASRARLSQA